MSITARLNDAAECRFSRGRCPQEFADALDPYVRRKFLEVLAGGADR